MADQIVHECVSEAEAAAGRLGAAKLARLVAGWKRDGLAVLANVIEDGPALDAIRERLDFDAAHRYANGDIFKGTGPAPPKATDPEYVAALAEGRYRACTLTRRVPPAPNSL